MPQIEVTFDIDANGILNVSAKDKKTGKTQKITIQTSSGLTEEEVKKMQSDAEAHASEDKKRRELVDLKNQADSAAYSVEKTLKEQEGKVDAALKSEAESKVAALRATLEGDDAEAIRAAMAALEPVLQGLGAAMQGQQAGPQGASDGGGEASSDAEEDIKDADFEVKS
jgi:molecular chaperone DnaK